METSRNDTHSGSKLIYLGEPRQGKAATCKRLPSRPARHSDQWKRAFQVPPQLRTDVAHSIVIPASTGTGMMSHYCARNQDTSGQACGSCVWSDADSCMGKDCFTLAVISHPHRDIDHVDSAHSPGQPAQAHCAKDVCLRSWSPRTWRMMPRQHPWHMVLSICEAQQWGCIMHKWVGG